MNVIPLPTDHTRRIVAEVAERYGLTFDDLTGKRRPRPIAYARMAAYAEVRARRPHLGLTQIGAVFGGRDHSTILTGIQKHHARVAWVEALKAAVPTAERRAAA